MAHGRAELKTTRLSGGFEVYTQEFPSVFTETAYFLPLMKWLLSSYAINHKVSIKAGYGNTQREGSSSSKSEVLATERVE